MNKINVSIYTKYKSNKVNFIKISIFNESQIKMLNILKCKELKSFFLFIL